MFRRLVPMISLVAAWGIVVAAAPAQAQVNIDQGKSAAEIFSGDCGTCHKTAKGLANGRNAGASRGLSARALYVKRPASLFACGLRPWRRLGTCAYGQSEAEGQPGSRRPAKRSPAKRPLPILADRKPARAQNCSSPIKIPRLRRSPPRPNRLLRDRGVSPPPGNMSRGRSPQAVGQSRGRKLRRPRRRQRR